VQGTLASAISNVSRICVFTAMGLAHLLHPKRNVASARVPTPGEQRRVNIRCKNDGVHLMDDDGTSRVEIVVRDGSTQLIMNEKHNGRVFRAP